MSRGWESKDFSAGPQAVMVPGPSGILVFSLEDNQAGFERAVAADKLHQAIVNIRRSLRKLAVTPAIVPTFGGSITPVIELVDSSLAELGLSDLFKGDASD